MARNRGVLNTNCVSFSGATRPIAEAVFYGVSVSSMYIALIYLAVDAATKRSRIFVQVDDRMGKSKGHNEQTTGDSASLKEDDGTVISDLIWFRVEN